MHRVIDHVVYPGQDAKQEYIKYTEKCIRLPIK